MVAWIPVFSFTLPYRLLIRVHMAAFSYTQIAAGFDATGASPKKVVRTFVCAEVLLNLLINNILKSLYASEQDFKIFLQVVADP